MLSARSLLMINLLTVALGETSLSAEVAAVRQDAATSNESPKLTGEREVAGIWIGRDEIMRRPTAGRDWDELLRDAERELGPANIADQDSRHDVFTLAAALVCVRTAAHCEKATQGVLAAIGTEAAARWLAVGRNLGSYVIAADLLDLRAGGGRGAEGEAVEHWLESFMTKRIRDNNTDELREIAPFESGANASAQEGFVYTALAVYLRDERALERAWDSYRTFVCDSSTPTFEIELRRAVRDGWAHDDRQPCAINPAGAVKVVPGSPGTIPHMERIDGAIIADMRRGGRFQSRPAYTEYPWVGLQGLVPAAVILDRAGYPAFEAGDRALLRTHDYLWHRRAVTGDVRWFDGSRAREIVHLINVAYGAAFPISETIGAGRTVGYTGWTHPR